jgi:peroxiredoxin
MKLKPGQKIKSIELPAIDGTTFKLNNIKGKTCLISFFRFAGCPFCNLRMHELVKRYDELDKNFTIIAIFDSPLDNLIEHAAGHKAPFPILADENNIYYKEYAIEHSISGVLKGMIFRMPTLLKGMMKGYIPLKFKGSITTMPAEFLVDSEGIIKMVHYGKDEGDHLPFEIIKEFSMKK